MEKFPNLSNRKPNIRQHTHGGHTDRRNIKII